VYLKVYLNYNKVNYKKQVSLENSTYLLITVPLKQYSLET